MEAHDRDEEARGFRVTKQVAREGHGRGKRLCLNRCVLLALPPHGWGLRGPISFLPPTFDHDATRRYDDGFFSHPPTRPYLHSEGGGSKAVRMRLGFRASPDSRKQSSEAREARRRWDT